MNPLKWLFGYFRGVQVELRKVVWPPFPILMQHFFSVVIGMAVATAFIWAADTIFIQGLRLLIK